MHTIRRLFLTSCLAVAIASPALAGKSNDTLVAAFPREVRTLDGNYANLRENDMLGLLTDDALFTVDPESGRAVPLAAKAHEFRDKTTLVVDLRDDVLFHDGSTMTAEDVVYTYTWLLDERSKNNYLDRFGRWLASVEAEGPNRVVFRMKEPYAMALYDLAMYSKVRKKGTHDDPSKPGSVNPGAQTLELNGTGPYRVVSFRPGQQIVLQRFDKYRSNGPKGTPPIRNITIRIIPDWSTQAAEVMSGGVNWTFEIPTDIAEGAAQTGQAQLVSGPSMRTFYISLDAAGKVQKDGALTKLKVRQALNHAIDREGITKNLLKGTAQVLHTPCVPVQFGCDEAVAQKYPYDPAKAKALLQEAGYPNGIDFEFWSARDKAIIEAIANQWRAVGIRANVRLVKGPTLSEARQANQIHAEFASSGSFGVPDAGAILPDRLGPGSGRNYSGDAQLGEMIMRAVTYDEAERKAAFTEAIKRTTEQAYWVPLYTESQDFLMTKDVSYAQAADGMARLYLVRWK